MGKAKYLEGHKFGEIMLLKRVEGNPNKPRGLFLCVCGAEFETVISSVVSGHTKSCGCYYKETRPKIKNVYEVGEQIGTCFYIGDTVYKLGTPRRATFRCHCGNYFITAIQNLDNGTTKSCGCQTIELLRKYGNSPRNKMPKLSQDDIDKFWSMVDVKEDKAECWDWKFGGERYGHFKFKGVSYKSNRIAFFISTGKDPENMEVMHSCHRPKCSNPNHLSLGTHWDNMQDMKNSGRAYNGKEFKMYKDC